MQNWTRSLNAVQGIAQNFLEFEISNLGTGDFLNQDLGIQNPDKNYRIKSPNDSRKKSLIPIIKDLNTKFSKKSLFNPMKSRLELVTENRKFDRKFPKLKVYLWLQKTTNGGRC